MKKSGEIRVERCFVVDWARNTEYGNQTPLLEYFVRTQSSRYLLDILFYFHIAKNTNNMPFFKVKHIFFKDIYFIMPFNRME